MPSNSEGKECALTIHGRNIAIYILREWWNQAFISECANKI